MKLTYNEQAAKIFQEDKSVTSNSLQELSEDFLRFRVKKEKYKDRARKYEKKEELAEETLYKQMLQLKVSSFKRKTDGVLLSTSDKKHYFAIPEKKEIFFKILEKIGEEGIIKTDVEWRAVQALMSKINDGLKSEIVSIQVRNKKIYKALMNVLKFTERTSIRVTGLKRGGKE